MRYMPYPKVLWVASCCCVSWIGCGVETGRHLLEEDVGGGIGTVSLRPVLDSARALYDDAEYNSARAVWEEALLEAHGLADSAAETEALTWLCLTAWQLAEYVEARRLGEEALALKRRYGFDTALAPSYNALGLIAWDEGRLSDAAALFRETAVAARAVGNDRYLAAANGNLGLIQTDLGNFDEAREGFEQLRDGGRRLGNPVFEANGLTNLGMLAVTTGDPLSAIPFLQHALQLYRSTEYTNGEQIALAQLSAAYAAIGEPRLAFSTLDTALQLSRETGQRDEEARNLEQLAALHREAGNVKHALNLYQTTQQMYEELGLGIESGTNLRRVAEVHMSLGDLENARSFATRALGQHRNAGDRFEELNDALLLAEIEHSAGSLNDVARHLHDARLLASELDASSSRLAVALAEARIADRNSDHASTRRVITRVEDDLGKSGPDAESEAYAMLSRAHARLEQLDSSAAYGRRAVAAAEKVRRNFGSSQLRTSYTAMHASVYGDLVSVLIRLDSLEAAFAVFDAARGRSLAEHIIVARRERSELDSTTHVFAESERLLRRIDRLISTLNELENLPVDERNPEAVADVDRRLREARSLYQARIVEVDESTGSSAALLGIGSVTLGDVRAVLSPDEALLEYLVTGERVWAVVVRNDDAQVFSSEIDEEDLESRVRLARGLVADPDAPRELTRDVLDGLYSVLIRPALQSGALAQTKRLIIVPHRVLNYVPFAALRDSAAGTYLVEEYSLLHLPSASALPALRRRDQASIAQETDVLDTRVTLFAPLAASLPASGAEIRAIQEIFSRSDEHLNDRATESRFRTALTRGDLTHVATHGVLNVRNPMFSRIQLARGYSDESRDDGRLEVHEVLAIRVASPLVFLSGCETGVGGAWRTEYARGDDYATLAQAFLYAGARNVVATLWRIDDMGAAIFAERFYENLLRHGASEALSRAQRNMIALDTYGSPYYWSGYRLAGVGEIAW
jgi:CHAT domain-containing protein